MQSKIDRFRSLEEALVSVRSKIDELPAYHGKYISYTVLPEQKAYNVYVNRKAVNYEG